VSAVLQPPMSVAQTSPVALTTAERAIGPRLEPLAYRVNDAIKVSGLGRSSIYKLISDGKLRSVLVAGRRLIPADALGELLRGAA
jgi:excisionase family DNA binding protein